MAKNFTVLMILLALFSFTSMNVKAQGIKGKVIDNETGQALVGATIKVDGENKGAIADDFGRFEMDLKEGSYKIAITYVGYEEKTLDVKVVGDNYKNLGNLKMQAKAIGLGGVSIIADRAKERETPVAISNVDAKQLEKQLGSQDIPMIMNTTPSVYATAQGGGAGDARINVRGFDQRNVAIMINGVPINDMENGWVYWSNWDGLADATSSIQMQRGLSAVNLATPSIGGTMNIITSPAEMDAGVSGKFEIGSGNFMKSTISGNSGLINNKYAVSAAVVRKVGDGVIDGTWTDAWAYYLGASYNVSDKHRVEAFLMGAPQRHGQNLYKQNAAAYDSTYARSIGIADSTIMKYTQSESGRLYNENWSPVSESYDGKQFWNGKERDRFSKNFINERENYYHKPLANLNWYAKWSDKISQFTTLYYSGGTGGGSGTIGSMKWDYASEPTRIVDYDATIANNSDTAWGVLRNSTNNQWTIGAISKIKVDFSENFKGQFGLDWRTAEIAHFREVRDLLGGDYFYSTANQFESGDEFNKGLGGKIDYNFTNTVDWFGAYAQLEYTNEKMSAYATFGQSMIKYSYTNHFVTADTLANGNPDVNSGELKSETDWILGNQIKGGLNYNILEELSIYANLGLVSKAPIFDNVINDRDATVAENPQNENFTAYEFGAILGQNNDQLKIKANYYNTLWENRSRSVGVINQDGSEGFVFIQGMDQKHTGFELELDYQPNKVFAVGGLVSVGNWYYLNNVTGTYKDYAGGGVNDVDYEYYVEGLKVGDAPQHQFAAWLDLYPIKGLGLQFVYRYNSNHYAAWDPFSRTDENDKEQVWMSPAYSLLDFHANYRLPIKGRTKIDVFLHVFNLLDEIYIQDATDNSRYNGFYGHDNRYSHTVNSAEVFLGLPRTFNAGLKLTFN